MRFTITAVLLCRRLKVNLMVFGPGNYQFHDFLMVGGVLVAVLTPAAGVFTYYLI